MTGSYSATGLPAQVKETVAAQCLSQSQSSPCSAAIFAAARDYVITKVDEKPADATISVSASFYISIT